MKDSHNLRWRIVTILLIASLLPLGLLAIGAWILSERILEQKALEMHHRLLESHARSVDVYLSERLRALDLVARTNGMEGLRDERKLGYLLSNINDSYGMSFVDLGVIAEDGTHLAYAGPYELRDKNYAEEPWFKDAMLRGSHISDVFLGFRRVPHFVLVILRREGPDKWLLRATINSDVFDKFVQTGRLGKTGDAFIVNSTGLYQTSPRSGSVLEQSPITSSQLKKRVLDSRVRDGGTTLLRAGSWINGGRWMLVIQQDEAEIEAPVRRAVIMGIPVVLVAVVLVVMTTFFATRHLTSQIDLANEQRDALSRDLIRSAKLASLGEMATGMAHEINNPLAIIVAEQTNIGDLAGDLPAKTNERSEILQSVKRCKRQVQRCGGITSKMLQFGRKTEIKLEPTDVTPLLDEIVKLMQKQAEVRDVELQLDMEDDLPKVMLDPTELEQVIINLINNSLDAAQGNGHILVSAQRNNGKLVIEVTDDGCGIAPGDLERVFQPFFTTKPPGEGTGLGLSVCYGIVNNWGGDITVKSKPAGGTEVALLLPIKQERPLVSDIKQGA